MSPTTDLRVAVLLTDRARQRLLGDAAAARLEKHADVVWAQGDPDGWDLDALLHDADAALTGWWTPALSEALIEAHPRLGFIGHTAGSVRGLIPLELIGHRIRVSQATEFFAPSVSEFTLLHILSSLRHLPALDRELKAGAAFEDFEDRYTPGLLRGRTVGVVGASRSGRAVVKLLLAFGARVLVVDPTVADSEIVALGAEPVADLSDALPRVDILTLHAPLLDATEGMIGAAQLGLLRDGALFVNCARGGLVDDDALYAEVASGRIRASLDVFAEEPLPLDDRWRSLEDVVISPHRAGFTVEALLQNGEAMIDDLLRWRAGEPLRYELPAERVDVIA